MIHKCFASGRFSSLVAFFFSHLSTLTIQMSNLCRMLLWARLAHLPTPTRLASSTLVPLVRIVLSSRLRKPQTVLLATATALRGHGDHGSTAHTEADEEDDDIEIIAVEEVVEVSPEDDAKHRVHQREEETTSERSGGGATASGGAPPALPDEEVASIDVFARAKIGNFVKRCLVEQSSQPNQQGAIIVAAATTSLFSATNSALNFNHAEVQSADGLTVTATLPLPVPVIFGERVAQGTARSQKDAEDVCCMHAVRIVDALGLQLYSISSTQKKHADAAAAVGRYAPSPTDVPKPAETPTPAALSLKGSGTRRSHPQTPSSFSLPQIDWSKYQLVRVADPQFKPLQLTLLDPSILDQSSVRRMRQWFFGQGTTLDKHMKLLRRSGSDPVFTMRLELPIDPKRYGPRVAIAVAEDKFTAFSLACMHAELILDAIGVPLYTHDAVKQKQHADECRLLGRWATPSSAKDGGAESSRGEGGSSDRSQCQSPLPLRFVSRTKTVDRDADARRGASSDARGAGATTTTTLMPVMQSPTDVLCEAGNIRPFCGSLDDAAAGDFYFFLRRTRQLTAGGLTSAPPSMDSTPEEGWTRGGGNAGWSTPVVAKGDEAAAESPDELPHGVNVQRIGMGSCRGAVVFEVAKNHKVMALAIADRTEDCETLTCMHALQLLFHVGTPVYTDPSRQSALVLRSKTMGWWVSQNEHAPLPPPLKAKGSRQGRMHLSLTEAEVKAGLVHKPLSSSPSSPPESDFLAARATGKRARWSLEPDTADHLAIIVAAPQSHDDTLTLEHTLVSPRVLDLHARARLADFMERHGRERDAACAVSRVEGEDGRLVFRATSKLPVPIEFGSRVAIGEAYTEQEAELLVAMHAEVIIDCLGLPFYDHAGLQDRHAAAARSFGRYAPFAKDAPRSPDVPSPPRLRKLLPQSIRWLRNEVHRLQQHETPAAKNFATGARGFEIPSTAATTGGTAGSSRSSSAAPSSMDVQKDPLEGAPQMGEMPVGGDSDPHHALRLKLRALASMSAIEDIAHKRLSLYLMRAGTSLRDTMQVVKFRNLALMAQGGIEWRCLLEVPLPHQRTDLRTVANSTTSPWKGRLTAFGVSYKRQIAIDLCCMHAVEILDALGICVISDPKMQDEHVDYCRQRGRQAPRYGEPRIPLPAALKALPKGGFVLFPPGVVPHPDGGDTSADTPLAPSPRTSPAVPERTQNGSAKDSADAWRANVAIATRSSIERARLDALQWIQRGLGPRCGDPIVDGLLSLAESLPVDPQAKVKLLAWLNRLSLAVPTANACLPSDPNPWTWSTVPNQSAVPAGRPLGKHYVISFPVKPTPFMAVGVGSNGVEATSRAALHCYFMLQHCFGLGVGCPLPQSPPACLFPAYHLLPPANAVTPLSPALGGPPAAVFASSAGVIQSWMTPQRALLARIKLIQYFCAAEGGMQSNLVTNHDANFALAEIVDEVTGQRLQSRFEIRHGVSDIVAKTGAMDRLEQLLRDKPTFQAWKNLGFHARDVTLSVISFPTATLDAVLEATSAISSGEPRKAEVSKDRRSFGDGGTRLAPPPTEVMPVALRETRDMLLELSEDAAAFASSGVMKHADLILLTVRRLKLLLSAAAGTTATTHFTLATGAGKSTFLPLLLSQQLNEEGNITTTPNSPVPSPCSVVVIVAQRNPVIRLVAAKHARRFSKCFGGVHVLSLHQRAPSASSEDGLPSPTAGATTHPDGTITAAELRTCLDDRSFGLGHAIIYADPQTLLSALTPLVWPRAAAAAPRTATPRQASEESCVVFLLDDFDTNTDIALLRLAQAWCHQRREGVVVTTATTSPSGWTHPATTFEGAAGQPEKAANPEGIQHHYLPNMPFPVQPQNDWATTACHQVRQWLGSNRPPHSSTTTTTTTGHHEIPVVVVALNGVASLREFGNAWRLSSSIAINANVRYAEWSSRQERETSSAIEEFLTTTTPPAAVRQEEVLVLATSCLELARYVTHYASTVGGSCPPARHKCVAYFCEDKAEKAAMTITPVSDSVNSFVIDALHRSRDRPGEKEDRMSTLPLLRGMARVGWWSAGYSGGVTPLFVYNLTFTGLLPPHISRLLAAGVWLDCVDFALSASAILWMNAMGKLGIREAESAEAAQRRSEGGRATLWTLLESFRVGGTSTKKSPLHQSEQDQYHNCRNFVANFLRNHLVTSGASVGSGGDGGAGRQPRYELCLALACPSHIAIATCDGKRWRPPVGWEVTFPMAAADANEAETLSGSSQRNRVAVFWDSPNSVALDAPISTTAALIVCHPSACQKRDDCRVIFTGHSSWLSAIVEDDRQQHQTGKRNTVMTWQKAVLSISRLQTYFTAEWPFSCDISSPAQAESHRRLVNAACTLIADCKERATGGDG